MKKMVLIAATMMTVAVPAFAQSRHHDDGRNDRRDSRGGIIIDISPGGIDAYVDLDRRDRRPRDPRDRQPRPTPGRRYACFAEDRRGRTYRAIDITPNIAQAKALDRCYDVSSRCRPLGCQRQ